MSMEMMAAHHRICYVSNCQRRGEAKAAARAVAGAVARAAAIARGRVVINAKYNAVITFYIS